MATEVFLISPEFIRNNSNMSINIQDKMLQSAIREATNIDFQLIVGTRMLNKLKALVADGTIVATTNAAYKGLLDNAKYFLMYNVIKRVIVIASAKIDNTGINRTSDEHIEPLELDDVFRMRNYYENMADFYCKLLQGYILDNRSKLKEISADRYHNLDAQLRSSARCGVFLGGARGKKYRGW